jgi:hypothetical protein
MLAGKGVSPDSYKWIRPDDEILTSAKRFCPKIQQAGCSDFAIKICKSAVDLMGWQLASWRSEDGV